MKQYPRMLVISYNCFLSSNSNGRTLLNLIYKWPSTHIAQIYMSNDYPDYRDCGRYYRVTDINALNAFLGKKDKGGVVDIKQAGSSVDNNSIYLKARRSKTNRFIKLARRMVWNSGRWNSSILKAWINDFNPEVILLFSGNNSFIDRYAWKVSDEYRIPIILYNCEDYYLKPLRDKHLLTYINRIECNKAFEETMDRTIGVVYNSPKLMESYSRIFKNSNSIVLYNPADDYFLQERPESERRGIAYLGNITIGREKSLCEIADSIGKLGLKLDVYGAIPDDEVKRQIEGNESISYHGVVSYRECCNIMINSMILVHAESFTVNKELHLSHVFSTKIADSLASGACLFVYAPSDIALTEYLENTNSAVIATSHDEMVSKINVIIKDRSYRDRIRENAKRIVQLNHIKSKTAEEFYDFVISRVSEGQPNNEK